MVGLPDGSVALVLVLLITTTGCVGVLTGDQPLSFESDPVSVSPAAQDDAGYEEARITTQNLTRDFSAAGQTREVTVTNHVAEYSRSVDLGAFGSAEFARFVVVSTPAVEVLGQTFNPIDDMSDRELAEQVQSQYEGLEDLRSTGERQAQLLGTETTVSTFATDAELGSTGQSIELTIHVTRVRHEADFVVVVAVHPSLLDAEAGRVDTMLAGVQHGSV